MARASRRCTCSPVPESAISEDSRAALANRPIAKVFLEVEQAIRHKNRLEAVALCKVAFAADEICVIHCLILLDFPRNIGAIRVRQFGYIVYSFLSKP